MHRHTRIPKNTASKTSSLAPSACKNRTSVHSISRYNVLHYKIYKPRHLALYVYEDSELAATLIIQAYIPVPFINAIFC